MGLWRLWRPERKQKAGEKRKGTRKQLMWPQEKIKIRIKCDDGVEGDGADYRLCIGCCSVTADCPPAAKRPAQIRRRADKEKKG